MQRSRQMHRTYQDSHPSVFFGRRINRKGVVHLNNLSQTPNQNLHLEQLNLSKLPWAILNGSPKTPLQERLRVTPLRPPLDRPYPTPPCPYHAIQED